MSVDPRDEITAELRRQLAERDAIIAQLRAEIADLKEKLGKSSRNSSKPPSSDSPGTGRPKRRSHRKPSGKKRGAQPGHPKHERPFVPESELDKIHDIKPTECESCGRPLRGDDSEPERHQVTDIPMPNPTTDEYRLHALGCACGHVTRAKLPDGVPTGAFGPGIVARVALVIGAYRLSKRLTVGKRPVQPIFSEARGLCRVGAGDESDGNTQTGNESRPVDRTARPSVDEAGRRADAGGA